MTKLTIQCDRQAGVKAEAYKDISHDDVDDATRVALRDLGVEVQSCTNPAGKIILKVSKITLEHRMLL